MSLAFRPSLNRVAAISLAATFLFGISACTKKAAPPVGELSPAEKATQLADRGRKSYLANCIACHNPDPKKDGVLGPAVHGSSFELLSARILDASYPPAYKPKRDTKTMVALPHLKGDLEALNAFLNTP